MTANCPEARIVRIPFSMACKRGISEKRKASWQASADAAVGAFRDGATGLRLEGVTLASRFESYALPRAIRVLDRLPLKANGKIDRQAVLRLFTP